MTAVAGDLGPTTTDTTTTIEDGTVAAAEVPDTTIVVPTVGRDSLHRLLDSLFHAEGTTPRVVVVDDRPDGAPLALRRPGVDVMRSGGRGPAAARNRGSREATTAWVSFLDDDVVVEPDWLTHLAADLEAADASTVAIEGRVRVPLPADRAPLDAERGTAGLETARWITADMTVRRSALKRVGGFDERFRRAYREDAELGLRLETVGRIAPGARRVVHPVRDDGDWFSLRQQRGNADDVLMDSLHGRTWRAKAGAPRGAFRRHCLTVAAAMSAVFFGVIGRRRAAGAAFFGWSALTARFAWSRIAPGPRDRDEVRRMVLTSIAIPFAAVRWRLHGLWQHRRPRTRPEPRHRLPDLVLFDRDGTLIHDVPYNGEPDRVVPVDGAREALDLLRGAGLRIGIVSNQSGIARGLISSAQLEAVNQRVDDLLGPFDTWQICPHGPDDGCQCRKPHAAMVLRACAELDVAPTRCVVIGDIGSDVDAALAAGASGVIVPNDTTLQDEVDAAPRVERTVQSAARSVLRGDWR